MSACKRLGERLHQIEALDSTQSARIVEHALDSHLLISSLPGSALRMHVESLGKPCDVNKRSQNTHLVFSNGFTGVFKFPS